MYLKHRLPLLIFLLLTFSAAWVWISAPNLDERFGYQTASPAVGFLAPDFELTSIDGARIKLSDQRGKVVMINFWASWCPPCRTEMPAIQNLYNEYSTENLTILAINATNVDSDTAAYNFLRDNQLTFPILFDREGTINKLYRATSLPTTYFIDQKGIIQDIVIGGPMSEAFLRIQLNELLSSLE